MPDGDAPFDPEGGRELAIITRAALRRAKQAVMNPPGNTSSSKAFNRARATTQVNDLSRDLRAMGVRVAEIQDARGRRAYLNGRRDAEKAMRKAGLSKDTSPIQASLTGAETRRARVILRPAQQDTAQAFRSMENVAGRAIRQIAALDISGSKRTSAQINAELKRILATGAIAGEPARTGQALKKMLDKIVNKDGLVEVMNKNGVVMTFPPDHYADLVFQTAMAEATNIAFIDQQLAKGSHYVKIIGSNSANFCTAFVGKVFYIGPGQDPLGHFPHISTLPRGGAPFHPRCTKRYVPFNVRMAKPEEIEAAKLSDAEKATYLGKSSTDTQKAHEAEKPKMPDAPVAENTPSAKSPQPSALAAAAAEPTQQANGKAAPSIVDVVDRVDLPKTGETSKVVRAAAESIQKVHRLPATAKPVPLQVLGNAKFEGQLKISTANEPIVIQIRSSTKFPRSTAAHELGHYFEHQVVGDIRAATTHPAFEEWRVAVRKSKGFDQLYTFAQVKRTRYTAYLVSPEELFARSYAQWIATRSADAAMLAELRLIASLTRPPIQWDAADFASIAAAFDLAIERLGLKP